MSHTTLQKNKLKNIRYIITVTFLVIVAILLSVMTSQGAWVEPGNVSDSRPVLLNRGPVTQVRSSGGYDSLGIGGSPWTLSAGNLFDDKLTVHEPVDLSGGVYAKDDSGITTLAAVVNADVYAGYQVNPLTQTVTPLSEISYGIHGNVEVTNSVTISNLAHGNAGALEPVCTTTEGWIIPCTTTPATEICGNGIDDDGDGLVDENCPEICGNGIDDDGDGLVDENDPDCLPPPPAYITAGGYFDIGNYYLGFVINDVNDQNNNLITDIDVDILNHDGYYDTDPNTPWPNDWNVIDNNTPIGISPNGPHYRDANGLTVNQLANAPSQAVDIEVFGSRFVQASNSLFRDIIRHRSYNSITGQYGPWFYALGRDVTLFGAYSYPTAFGDGYHTSQAKKLVDSGVHLEFAWIECSDSNLHTTANQFGDPYLECFESHGFYGSNSHDVVVLEKVGPYNPTVTYDYSSEVLSSAGFTDFSTITPPGGNPFARLVVTVSPQEPNVGDIFGPGTVSIARY